MKGRQGKHLQAKECLRLPKARTDQRQVLPQSPQEPANPADTLISDLGPPELRMIFDCVSHPVCGPVKTVLGNECESDGPERTASRAACRPQGRRAVEGRTGQGRGAGSRAWLGPRHLSQMVQAPAHAGRWGWGRLWASRPAFLPLVSASWSTPRLTPAPGRRKWREEIINPWRRQAKVGSGPEHLCPASCCFLEPYSGL